MTVFRLRSSFTSIAVYMLVNVATIGSHVWRKGKETYERALFYFE